MIYNLQSKQIKNNKTNRNRKDKYKYKKIMIMK
jgi:hypothetical protein